MKENNNIDVGPALVAGLEVLDDSQTRIPGDKVDNISTLKGLMRALLKGELGIASPDRILSEEEKPTTDNLTNEEN